MVFEGFPYVIGWELTLACNLRCQHCGSSAGYPREQELTSEEAIAICNQFSDLLVQEVHFTGGEPLLRPDWPIILAHLRDLGIRRHIISNGLVLDERTISQLKAVEISSVGISLDGLDYTHDEIRGHKGLYSSVLEGISRLQKADIPVTILTTVNGKNIYKLPKMLDLLCSFGIKNWQLQPIFPLGRVLDFTELHLSEMKYNQLGLFVKEYEIEAKRKGMDLSPADSFGYFTEVDTRVPQWNGCTAGLCECGITSDGKVKGCLSMPDTLIEGDLRKNDLWEIWFDNDAFAYTRKFSIDQLGINCKSCEKAEQCKGGCTSMSYGSTGTFHNDPYCFHGIRMRLEK